MSGLRKLTCRLSSAPRKIVPTRRKADLENSVCGPIGQQNVGQPGSALPDLITRPLARRVVPAPVSKPDTCCCRDGCGMLKNRSRAQIALITRPLARRFDVRFRFTVLYPKGSLPDPLQSDPPSCLKLNPGVRRTGVLFLLFVSMNLNPI
jgi:hypothetical protein